MLEFNIPPKQATTVGMGCLGVTLIVATILHYIILFPVIGKLWVDDSYGRGDMPWLLQAGTCLVASLGMSLAILMVMTILAVAVVAVVKWIRKN